MWETMKVQHENQSRIAKVLRDNLDLSQSTTETTEHHHERTIQLLAVVQDWYMQFCKLIDHQKEYTKALSNWLRLNLIPIERSMKEKVSSPPRLENPLFKGSSLVGRTSLINFRMRWEEVLLITSLT